MILSERDRELTERLVEYKFYTPMTFFRNISRLGFIGALKEDWDLTVMRQGIEAESLLDRYSQERRDLRAAGRIHELCYLDKLMLQRDAKVSYRGPAEALKTIK